MKELKTHAGFPIAPAYGPEDLAGVDFERDIGRPGEYPFTRGIHKHMYRERLWTMRQYIGFGTPEETNERFKYLMAHGQDALNVAFDLPTQLGLDSDDVKAEGEVGRVGMPLVEAAFRTRTTADWLERLQKLNVPATPILTEMLKYSNVKIAELRATGAIA